ncbi:MAG: TonB-dependent receptor [Flavobacteriales bacterium]|nr:TonB-dependent receptor [Flavobacteriales bacterium]
MAALWAFDASAQDPPDRDFLRSFEGKSLTVAAKKLRKKSGISFSYSSGSIDNVTIPAFSDSVSTVDGFLAETLEGTLWDFERIGGTYVIFLKPYEDDAPKSVRTDFPLSGVVRDAETGEALPFATVAVLGAATSATTNTDGKFTLLKVPSDTATVSVRYLGYEPISFRLNPGAAAGLLSLEMDRSERTLPSVEIAARKEQMIEIGSMVGQLAFNPAEIARLPNLAENDLFAALRFLPGVSANREASSGLRIRGSGSDQNMVLFDGIPVYHVDHFFGFLSAFNSNVVKNVQVSKGGFGARFGGRAAGLVNITGIDGNKKKPSLTLEASALSMSVLAELPIVEEKASLVFAYRRAYTDIIGSPTYRGMFNNLFNSSIPNVQPSEIDVFSNDPPDYSFYDLNAKFHFKPSEKDAISVSFYQGRDDLGIEFSGAANGVSRVSRDAVTWGNQGGSFKWSRKWSKRFFTYANYGISRYRSNLDAEVSFFRNDDVLLSRRFFDQRVNLDDNTLRIDNAYEVSPNGRLEFGFWNTDYRITMQAQDRDFIFSDSLQQARLTAGYIDYEQRLGRITAKGGIRTSYYDGDQRMYFEPRLSLSFDAGEIITLKASAGRYTQMIRRLNERSLYFSIPETWALAGQADVPVLNSDQFIAGFVLEKNGWQLDAEAYHKRENGVVEFLFPEFGLAGGSLDQLAIGGERRITGADFLLRKSFGKHRFLASYTIMGARSQYKGVNRGEAFRSAGVSTHEVGLVYNIQVKRWDFSGALIAASGQPYTPARGTFTVTLENGDQQQFVSLGRINSELTDWIHRADISAGYTVPLKNGALKFGFSVYNIYNNMNVKLFMRLKL